MPSLPLPRFLETEQTRRDHARKLERAVRESSGDIRTTKTAHTAADTLTLRGIPAIGRGVAGVIPGMRPDKITLADA